jgi:hypothetical protein
MKQTADEREGYGHDRCCENPGNGAVESEVEKSEPEGAQSGPCGEKRHGEGDYLPFPTAIREWTEEKLEQPEGQHVRGDKKPCPNG